MKIRKMLAVAAVLAAAGSGAVAVTASAAPAGHGRHHGHAVEGVCVSYASIGGIDQDIQVVSSIYTPAPTGRPCAKGDKFVAAGAITPGRAQR